MSGCSLDEKNRSTPDDASRHTANNLLVGFAAFAAPSIAVPALQSERLDRTSDRLLADTLGLDTITQKGIER